MSKAVKDSGLQECLRILEQAIHFVKTKPGDAKVILVGGGSIIIGNQIAGVGQVVRPHHFEVANAIGAAVCFHPKSWSRSLIFSRLEKLAGLWTR